MNFCDSSVYALWLEKTHFIKCMFLLFLPESSIIGVINFIEKSCLMENWRIPTIIDKVVAFHLAPRK